LVGLIVGWLVGSPTNQPTSKPNKKATLASGGSHAKTINQVKIKRDGHTAPQKWGEKFRSKDNINRFERSRFSLDDSTFLS
jgi:hypothetical protein